MPGAWRKIALALALVSIFLAGATAAASSFVVSPTAATATGRRRRRRIPTAAAEPSSPDLPSPPRRPAFSRLGAPSGPGRTSPRRRPSGRRPLALGAASGDAAEEEDETTLLRIRLSVVAPPAASGPESEDEALESVRAYVRSFPFAAVLPVQPLTYLPTEDGSGVRVTFLRKKTKEKGSVDGGIDFDVRPGGGGEGRRIDVAARRNSEGQTVSKAFSEMLVVKAFVAGITGEDGTRSDAALLEKVRIESVFHRWMQP